MEILPLVFTAIATVGLYACFYRWVQHRNLRGPRVWPILGSVLDVSRNHWRMHDYAYDYCKKYYPTYVTKMPGFNYVVTVDPANVEHVLKTNFSNYDKVRTHPHALDVSSSAHQLQIQFSRLLCLLSSVKTPCERVSSWNIPRTSCFSFPVEVRRYMNSLDSSVSEHVTYTS